MVGLATLDLQAGVQNRRHQAEGVTAATKKDNLLSVSVISDGPNISTIVAGVACKGTCYQRPAAACLMRHRRPFPCR
ncbi:MAG: hypothetical protein ACO37F_03620, partial [Pirellulales bacterium]